MQKETRRNSAAGSAKPNPPRKLTRAEKKQIAEIIRQAKGDGKAHTAQQTIPYIQMYPDGIRQYLAACSVISHSSPRHAAVTYARGRFIVKTSISFLIYSR